MSKKYRQFLKQQHPDADYVLDAAVYGRPLTEFYAVLSESGYMVYRVTDQKQLVMEDSFSWENVREAEVDHFFLTTYYTFNDSKNLGLTITGSENNITRYIEEKVSPTISKKDRKWYQKVLGFRSMSPWKMAVAALAYMFVLSTLLSIASDRSIGQMFYSLIGLILAGAFISSIIALYKGKLNVFEIPNRKRAGIIFTIAFLLISILPNPFPDKETASNDENVATASQNNEKEGETESGSDNNDLSEKTSDSKPDDQETNDQKEKDGDKEADNSQDESGDGNESKDGNDSTSDNASTNSSESANSNQSSSAADNEPADDRNSSASEDTSQTDTSGQENEQAGAPGDATATVTRVVDGDTVEINLNGKSEEVRLLLVDTPETVHPSEPVQPFGPQASDFTKEKLSGNQVRVEYDGPKRDKYDRLLAYLWVDGQNFNKMLLEQGLARYAYVYDPPYTHSDALMKAQNRAKSANRGIWSRNNYVASDGFNYQESQQSDHQESASSGTSNKESESNSSDTGGLKYDPNGADRDCGDFDTHDEAQDFYEAAGGPDEDPHRLDRDGNGEACESLPAA